MSAQHRGGRRPWRRRVPGLLVAFLAAASAAAVAGVALGGSGAETAATGASGAALTLAGGGIRQARKHRGSHRLVAARKNRGAPPVAELEPVIIPEITQQPATGSALAAAMSTPPAPRSPEVRWAPPRDWAPPAWSPALASADASADGGAVAMAEKAPSLFLVPAPDPMVDTVPHPVVKLFPLADLEPDLAAGSIDERVYAAIDEERRLAEAAALASGRHASSTPTDAARPRASAYRSRHSA